MCLFASERWKKHWHPAKGFGRLTRISGEWLKFVCLDVLSSWLGTTATLAWNGTCTFLNRTFAWPIQKILQCGETYSIGFGLMHSQIPGQVNDEEIVSLRKYIDFSMIVTVNSAFREDGIREIDDRRLR